MSELPIGYTSVGKHSVEVPKSWPEKIAICQPIIYGPPSTPAVIVRCIQCDAQCWRSRRVTALMAVVCDDCMDEYVPGWRKNHPHRNSEIRS